MAEVEEARNLLELGVGRGSKVEALKAGSAYLRGGIGMELREETTRFTDAQVQLLKFHGVYQQEDRDARQSRKAAGVEKAYMMMVRSRIPGGIVTAAQYLAQDELAECYGNHTLRITTRQSLQLHGVLKGDLHATINRINLSLLSTLAACGDVNRNVMCCPAPPATEVQQQVQAFAQRIAMHLAPRSRSYHEIWIDGEKLTEIEAPVEDGTIEPIYGPTYLPRKFKIGVALPDDNCIDIYTQDIGLVAAFDDGHLAGFTVLVGGGLGMTHGKAETYPRLATPLCFVNPDEAIAVVETIVTIQRDYGDRANRRHARMKYLVEERGIDWFREETARRLKRPLAAPRTVTWKTVDDHLGWHRQGNGRWYLGLYVENGRIKDEQEVQMRTALRLVMQRFAPGVRFTGQQNMLLTDVADEQRAPLESLLAAHGVLIDTSKLGVRRHAMACPALPTCGQALADAERSLPAVVRQIGAYLEQLGLADEQLSIRMTGCPNGCARPYLGDIGFVGRTRDVYQVYIGGDWANTRLNALYADSVHTSDLAETIRPLLSIWNDERHPGEGFGDFCNRVGLEQLKCRAGGADAL
jgi:sulfite reductase (ferredoxin)